MRKFTGCLLVSNCPCTITEIPYRVKSPYLQLGHMLVRLKYDKIAFMKKTDETNSYRQLPSVDRLLSEPRIRCLIDTYTHDSVANLIREEIDAARGRIVSTTVAPSFEEIVAAVEKSAQNKWRPQFIPGHKCDRSHSSHKSRSCPLEHRGYSGSF